MGGCGSRTRVLLVSYFHPGIWRRRWRQCLSRPLPELLRDVSACHVTADLFVSMAVTLPLPNLTVTYEIQMAKVQPQLQDVILSETSTSVSPTHRRRPGGDIFTLWMTTVVITGKPWEGGRGGWLPSNAGSTSGRRAAGLFLAAAFYVPYQ